VWLVSELIQFLHQRERNLANLMNFTTAQIATAFSSNSAATLHDFLPYPPDAVVSARTIEIIAQLQKEGLISRRTFGVLVTAKAISVG
jgi:hypothetical protein